MHKAIKMDVHDTLSLTTNDPYVNRALLALSEATIQAIIIESPFSSKIMELRYSMHDVSALNRVVERINESAKCQLYSRIQEPNGRTYRSADHIRAELSLVTMSKDRAVTAIQFFIHGERRF